MIKLISWIMAIGLWLQLAGCYTPASYDYEQSAVYGRVMKDVQYPADNDEAYIPIKRVAPKVKPRVVQPPRVNPPRVKPTYQEYEDNDAAYVFPKGRLARPKRQPYPQDNDSTYSYPRGYKPRNGSNGEQYPADNDATYVYPKARQHTPSEEDIYGDYPRDNESDMLDVYPLYFD